MARILVVADEPWARNEVHATLTDSDMVLIDHADPGTAAEAVAAHSADVVIVDMQVANMGAMAVTRSIRDATAKDGDGWTPTVIMLDRAADGFLAKRAGAAAWVTKPLGAGELRAAVRAVLGHTTDSQSSE